MKMACPVAVVSQGIKTRGNRFTMPSFGWTLAQSKYRTFAKAMQLVLRHLEKWLRTFRNRKGLDSHPQDLDSYPRTWQTTERKYSLLCKCNSRSYLGGASLRRPVWWAYYPTTLRSYNLTGQLLPNSDVISLSLVVIMASLRTICQQLEVEFGGKVRAREIHRNSWKSMEMRSPTFLHSEYTRTNSLQN